MDESKLYVGKRVKVKSRKKLIKLYGEEDGYPKTKIKFNISGEMDHIFGATGVVKSMIAGLGAIEVDFDNKVDGKIYGWAISADMLKEYKGEIDEYSSLVNGQENSCIRFRNRLYPDYSDIL